MNDEPIAATGIRISWTQFISALGFVLVAGVALATQQVRQEVRITNLEVGQAQMRSEMIGQKRFEEFSGTNQREHNEMIRQIENMQRDLKDFMRRDPK